VTIDLTKLESPRRFDERQSVAPERLDNELVVEPMAVRLEGVVRPQGEFFTVAGRSSVSGMLACSRCLEAVEWRESDEFSIRYRLSPFAEATTDDMALDDDDLEVVVLDGGELSLEELAAEQVLLALPMRFVCSDDCAGLCPQCGANRNIEGACRCAPETDPRWNALAELAKSGNRRS
jgi:uncharacterized protein